jgi:hypothetical protein
MEEILRGLDELRESSSRLTIAVAGVAVEGCESCADCRRCISRYRRCSLPWWFRLSGFEPGDGFAGGAWYLGEELPAVVDAPGGVGGVDVDGESGVAVADVDFLAGDHQRAAAGHPPLRGRHRVRDDGCGPRRVVRRGCADDRQERSGWAGCAAACARGSRICMTLTATGSRLATSLNPSVRATAAGCRVTQRAFCSETI